jgi:hypothetical protein
MSGIVCPRCKGRRVVFDRTSLMLTIALRSTCKVANFINNLILFFLGGMGKKISGGRECV